MTMKSISRDIPVTSFGATAAVGGGGGDGRRDGGGGDEAMGVAVAHAIDSPYRGGGGGVAGSELSYTSTHVREEGRPRPAACSDADRRSGVGVRVRFRCWKLLERARRCRADRLR